MNMRVSHQPKDTGIAGWNAILPPRDLRPTLEAAITADVAVIGGGYTGLTAAERLAELEPSLKIVLVDAVEIGTGPAGRNSGFMIDVPHDLASENYGGQIEKDLQQIKANRRAISHVLNVAERLGLDRSIVDPCGKYNLAVSDKGYQHNLAFQAHLKALGETATMVDAEQVEAITGTKFYTSGLFTPGAVMLQPAAYIRALLQTLPNAVQVFENTPVKSFEKQGQTWLLTTPQGKISAGRVVMAVNGHAQSFGYFKRRFIHLNLFASISKPMTEEQIKAMRGAETWAATPSDPLGSSVRKLKSADGDRILMRNTASYSPDMVTSDLKLRSAAKKHKAAIDRRWPQLQDLEIEHSWAGRLCLSKNSVSAFGELESNWISACCQNGLGAAKGTFAGLMAAKMVLDPKGQADLDLLQTLLAAPEPEKLPPKPIATLGARAIMQFKQWQARKEL